MIKKETNAMKKEQMEQDTRAKCAYAPPRVEIYAAEPGALLVGTNFGNDPGSASAGEYIGGSSEGGSAGQAHQATSAKAVILGQEFGFSDVWDD